MLWGRILSRIEADLDNIKRQFISIDDLLEILVNAEQSTKINASKWLLTSNVLGRTKALILREEYLLMEYARDEQDFFSSPIDTLTLIACGEDVFFTDCIGFARQRLLIDIKNKGVNISEGLIRSSAPYVSNNSYESDDNFYKNQCIDLIQELNTSESIKINQIKPPQNETRYLMLLDRNSPLFFGKLEAIARIYLDLNVLEKYSSRRNKDQRIKDCLEEYGGDYGLDYTTSFHIKALATLIPIKKEQKATYEILKELEEQK